MAKVVELLRSHHIQLALAAGASILAMAFASKYLLPEPIGYLPSALPPFLVVLYEVLHSRHAGSRLCTTWYWVVAIFITTALVILLHSGLAV